MHAANMICWQWLLLQVRACMGGASDLSIVFVTTACRQLRMMDCMILPSAAGIDAQRPGQAYLITHSTYHTHSLSRSFAQLIPLHHCTHMLYPACLIFLVIRHTFGMEYICLSAELYVAGTCYRSGACINVFCVCTAVYMLHGCQ
jgi:hypothetical protein